MARYRLISFKICPYVQRAAIALNAKGVDYDIEYVDLSDKPAWFVELSPLGKVPVLVLDDGTVLFESQVIAEYLDEVEPPRLHPEDPVRRAQHRAYIEVTNDAMRVMFRWKAETDAEKARAHARELNGHLRRLCREHRPGPFFEGDSFSLVDAAAAPLLLRCQWLEEVKPAGVFDGVCAERWRDAMMERDEVKRSAPPELARLFKATVKRLAS